jgi:ligand-binding sensor domain-containing protein
MEDSKGNMWFGGNDGAFIFNGKNLKTISEEDGLCNNVVNCILEDRDGNIWFATHHNSVCMWDGTTFTNINEDYGVNGIETWDLFEDSNGDIWFPVEQYGVYRYDRAKSMNSSKPHFTNFREADGLTTNAIQSAFEDKKGRIWLGGYQGLYLYRPSNSNDSRKGSIVPVNRIDPWPQ